MALECKNCRWFDELSKKNEGVCRREGPTVHVLLKSNGDTKIVDDAWPKVKVNDWCSHHAPGEKKR